MTTLTARGVSSPGRGDWKETLGRVGLVGKGVVFAVVGFLALQLALGDASQDTGKNGAIEWIASQPLGKFLLVALTVSLFALAAWRLLDAVVGDPVEGDEASDRAKYAIKGLFYVSLAISALSATVSNWSGSGSGGSGSGGSGGSGGSEGQSKQATATVLEWPGGRFLVIAGGLAIIGYALHLFKKHAIDEGFLQRMDIGTDSWLSTLGRFGYGARSIVYVVIGWFLFQAGVTYEAGKTKGLSGALQELSGKGWGQLVLFGVAVGLIAYGVFAMAEAKYRRAA